MKIVTLTANPLLDKIVHIDHLVVGKGHRAHSMKALAGGKGINVSRQLTLLSTENVATGFLGGAVGEQIESIARAEGIICDFVKISEQTREGYSLLDPDGVTTSIFEPPASVTPDEVKVLHQKLDSILCEGDWLVFAGSVPSSDMDSLYADLILWARSKGIRTFLDTYGRALELGLKAKPDFVKVNDDELGAFLSTDLSSENACLNAVQKVVGEFTSHVVLTRGAKDFFAASSEGIWQGKPPRVKALSAIGSGDSMSAGILSRLLLGDNFIESVKWGAAAGAANAAKWSVSDSTLDEVRNFLDQVEIKKIS